jgi:hypothetical protein
MPRLFGIGKPKAATGAGSGEKLPAMGFFGLHKRHSHFKPSSQDYAVASHNGGTQYFNDEPSLYSPSSPAGTQVAGGAGNSMWNPPPYSAAPPQNASARQPHSSGDSPYELLREFDTIFVVDDSSSMCGRRWKEAEEAIATIAPICTQYDPDGIDIYFLNHRNRDRSAPLGVYPNVTVAHDVQRIFSSVTPCGATPFGRRLHQILDPYMDRLEATTAAMGRDGNYSNLSLAVRPLNIIAITDGVFTDDAESVIVRTARRLDGSKCKAAPWQVGIQFFQVGDDPAARRYLEELDDSLEDKFKNEHIRDIVDTVPWKGEHGQTLSGDGILKVVLGAVHKKYDNRKAFG